MEPTSDYLKNFNNGYKLCRYSPELWEKLKNHLSEENETDKAVIDGAKQWELEKEKQRLKELDNLEQGKEKSLDLERE